MIDAEMRAYTQNNEGCSLKVYLDTRGAPTVGYGHKCTRGTTIPQAAADIIFQADYDLAVSGYRTLRLDLDDVRRSVIIDMIFQMGIVGVSKFDDMLTALRNKDFPRAANELMESDYARVTPKRAECNAERIKTGRM